MKIVKAIVAKIPFALMVYHWMKNNFVVKYITQVKVQKQVTYLRSMKGRPIKVCFCVIFDSVFPLELVFRLMLKDSCFDPYVMVIPDISRGYNNMMKVLDETLARLRIQYGSARILSSFDGQNFLNIVDKFDCFAMMNPYSSMTHKYYRIPYLAYHGAIVFMARYFTDTGTVYSSTFNELSELSYLWRFYAENKQDAERLGHTQTVLKRFNGILPIGLPKVDSFALVKPQDRERKRIIVAPHHSIDPIGKQRFHISNFPQYADFFLRLPELYPNIDWVFRPHPLTMVSMVNSGRWTNDQRVAYEEKIKRFPNVEYQTGGEYYSTFMNSDALIQDCSSFLPEYFFTGKPQCYMLSCPQSESEQFLEYGKKLLSHTYKAFSEKDILDFINTVVISGKDEKKNQRDAFLKSHLMFNFPHASEMLIQDLRVSFGR